MTPLPSIEPPTWRVIDPNGLFVGGTMWAKGAEVAHEGWPPNGLGLEPLNDSAKRIDRYWRKWQPMPGFPRSPRHPEHGLYLPGVLPRFGNALPNAISSPKIPGLVTHGDVDHGLSAMPEYTVRADHWSRHPDSGQRVLVVAWPIDLLTPENEPARLAAAYFAKHHEHPKLLSSPWCWLRGLFLPPLEEIKRDGNTLPLDQAKYAAAIESELAQVRPPVPITGPPTTTRSGTSTGVGRLAETALITRKR